MKKVGVIVTIEDKPADDTDIAKYLILLMDWKNRADKRKKAV
jgi:hypothetical protein